MHNSRLETSSVHTTDHYASASFSVIVPVRDALGYLRRTLPPIQEAVEGYGNAEIIVVDNGSIDGSYEWLKDHYSDTLRIVCLPQATVGAVRNYGVSYARGDFLCFIDADCVVCPDHLDTARRAMRASAADAVGSRYEIPAGAGWVESTWHQLHRTGREGFVDFLSAGNLVIDARAFREVGGFNEDLVTGEDAELCQRLRRRGHRIYQDPAIRTVHLGNAKTILGFFRKQRWYALGMLGTVHRSSLDKPTTATVLHVIVIAGVVGMCVLLSGDLAKKLLSVGGAVMLVPSLAVVYRWSQIGRVVRPLGSLVLYETFFAARIAATFLLLSGMISGWRPEPEGEFEAPDAPQKPS